MNMEDVFAGLNWTDRWALAIQRRTPERGAELQETERQRRTAGVAECDGGGLRAA